MTTQIRGLHHVTLLASGAQRNNDFFTHVIGLRRIKKTVNFHRPNMYHLYYGDKVGTPGGVITYFPFPDSSRGRHGTGEVGETVFAIPAGALPFWHDRLDSLSVADISKTSCFGDPILCFSGPDGEALALVEAPGDLRGCWTGTDISADNAIRGFHSVSLHVADVNPMGELLGLMGYEPIGKDGDNQRFAMPNGNGVNVVDLLAMPDGEPSRQGAGSVHHVAFAVADRDAQRAVRGTLVDAGFQVTEVIDRDYFGPSTFKRLAASCSKWPPTSRASIGTKILPSWERH